MYLIILVLLVLLYRFIRQEHHKVHPYGYTLLVEKENFESIQTCKDVSTFLLEHPSMVEGQGFSVYFDEAHDLETKFSGHNLNCVFDIFKKVKEPKTNSYVCNVMVVPPCNDKSDKEISVGGHYDGSLEETDCFGKYYMPLCTSILYLQTPENFHGGELFLKKYYCDKMYAQVKPKVGKYARFRGDMYHGVHKMYSDENTLRLSIVFEQYILPKTKNTFIVQDIFTESEYDETTGEMNYR
jgi:hypothetical protein